MITDETFLLYTGGIEKHFLNNILDINYNSNNNNENNELPMIRQSLYYDFEIFYSIASCMQTLHITLLTIYLPMFPVAVFVRLTNLSLLFLG